MYIKALADIRRNHRAGNALSVGSGGVSLHHNCIRGERRSAEVTRLVACARGLRRWRSGEKSRNLLNRALRALSKDRSTAHVADSLARLSFR